LTALAIGLEDEAVSTARSTTSATIEITLPNNGIDSYKPEIFVDESLAVRSINASKAKKFYQFFMKAAQIDAVPEKLNSCFQAVNMAQVQLTITENVLIKY
jgi:hypothetical protein